MTSWAKTPGYVRLKALQRGRAEYLREAPFLAVDLISKVAARDLQVSPNSRVLGTEAVVISWCSEADFSAGGAFHDMYFGVNAACHPDTSWIAISTDNFVPECLEENVGIVTSAPLAAGLPLRPAISQHPSSGAKRKDVFTPLVQRYSTSLTTWLCKLLRRELNGLITKRLIVAYEAQPFQNASINAARQAAANIWVTGYVHSALPPLPTDYLSRDGAPDELLVHGSAQAELAKTTLGWEASRVRVIPSMRYLQPTSPVPHGHIFFPYACPSPTRVGAELEALRVAGVVDGSQPWIVKPHPDTQPREVERLSTLVGRSLMTRKTAPDQQPSSSLPAIFIGATAAIVENLERGLDVIQVCPDPVFESHSSDLWQTIEVEQLTGHSFRYRLTEPGSLISFASNSNGFEQYCLS